MCFFVLTSSVSAISLSKADLEPVLVEMDYSVCKAPNGSSITHGFCVNRDMLKRILSEHLGTDIVFCAYIKVDGAVSYPDDGVTSSTVTGTTYNSYLDK